METRRNMSGVSLFILVHCDYKQSVRGQSSEHNHAAIYQRVSGWNLVVVGLLRLASCILTSNIMKSFFQPISVTSPDFALSNALTCCHLQPHAITQRCPGKLSCGGRVCVYLPGIHRVGRGETRDIHQPSGLAALERLHLVPLVDTSNLHTLGHLGRPLRRLLGRLCAQ